MPSCDNPEGLGQQVFGFYKLKKHSHIKKLLTSTTILYYTNKLKANIEFQHRSRNETRRHFSYCRRNKRHN